MGDPAQSAMSMILSRGVVDRVPEGGYISLWHSPSISYEKPAGEVICMDKTILVFPDACRLIPHTRLYQSSK